MRIPLRKARTSLCRVGFAFNPGITVLRVSGHEIALGTQNGLAHIFDREGVVRRSFHVGDGPVSELLVDSGGLKAAHCAGRLTLFDSEGVTGATELPEYFVALAECEFGVLAWKFNSVWLTEPSGRVQLAAQTSCPIRGVWGHAAGFRVLAGGELASFQRSHYA
jgi:hypothetical protein